MNLECKRCGAGYVLEDVQVVHRDMVTVCRPCARILLVDVLKRQDLFDDCLPNNRPGVLMSETMYQHTEPHAPRVSTRRNP